MLDPMSLLAREDSLLVVVDAQPGFHAGRALSAEDRAHAASALERAAWLVRVAARLGVPVVVTEEEPHRHGDTDAAVLAALPDGAPVLTKPTFGLAGAPELVAAVRATGRGTAVLVGFETDVCVAQSAIGLRELGLRAVVVDDATSSPGEMHARGLARLAGTGVERNHAKGVAYEWARTVEAAAALAAVADPPFRL